MSEIPEMQMDKYLEEATERNETALLSERIAELENLLGRVQIAMGVKKLPDQLMLDIRKALEAGDE